MKLKDLLKMERRLLLQLNGLPLPMRLMLANVYNQTIQASDDVETTGEEQELFFTMEELLNEHKDAATGG